MFEQVYEVSINQMRKQRIDQEKADTFYLRNQFYLLIKNLNIANTRMRVHEENSKKIISQKYHNNLKVMAFSALLWEKN